MRKFGQNSQSCQFRLKICTQSILRMLILIPNLGFSISNPKSIFGQIWVEKVIVVCFAWKLAYRVSRGCRLLFWHEFSQFPTLNPFLDKFGLRRSTNWRTYTHTYTHTYTRRECVDLEDADSYFNISFFKFQTKISRMLKFQT